MRDQFSVLWNDKLWRLSFFCILCMGIFVACTLPYQSVIGIEILGLSDVAFAMIMFASAALRVVFSLLTGVYSDQSGRYRDMLIYCTLIGLIGSVVMAAWPTALIFVLIQVLAYPLSTTTFNQCFALAQLAANRNERIDADASGATVRAAFSGSFAMTPPVIALLIAVGMGLMHVFTIAALSCLVMLVLIMTGWPKDQRRQEAASAGLTFFQALGELAAPYLLVRVLAAAMLQSVVSLYVLVFGLIILNNLNGTESDVGLFAGLIALIEVPIMLAAPLILRFISKPTFLMIGAFIHAIYFAPFGLMGSMSAAWWLVLPGGIGAGIILFTAMGYLQQLFAHRPGAGGSLIAISQFLSMLIASGTFAIGTSISDYVGTAWIGTGIGLVGGVLLFALDGGRIMSRAWLMQHGKEVPE